MRLLITGATGFVGRNLLLEALKHPEYDEIILPVRSLEKLKTQFIGDGIDEIPSRVRPIVTSGPDWKFGGDLEVDHVIHSVGLVFGRSREDYFRTNYDATLELFRRLAKVPGKVIILSSMAAAGPCPGESARTETDTDAPVTWYGQSKLEMERALKSEFSHMNYICLRPPLILGARDQASLPLFKMIRWPLHFKPGFKPKFFSYISVTDLVDAIFLALQNASDWTQLPRRHFFVASSQMITDQEILAISSQVSNSWGVVVKVPQPILKVVSKFVEAVPKWRTSVPTLSADRAREIWPDRWLISPMTSLDSSTGRLKRI